MKINILSSILCLFILIGNLQAQQKGIKLRLPDSDEEIQIYNDSWAIIIGINNYKYWPQLEYAVNDAKSMRDMLVNNFGFSNDKVFLLTDEEATLRNIKNTISDLSRKTGDNDRVLIYFSGHGATVQLPSGGDMGFLIPIEGSLDESRFYTTTYAMSDVKMISDMMPAKHVLFLVDACYSGLMASNQRGLAPKTQKYLQKITRARGRQIITAGSSGEQAEERAELGHGTFTYSLINGLDKGLADIDGDGIITATELGTYLKSNVARLSNNKQYPQSKFLSGDEGEFVFILDEVTSSQPHGILSVLTDPPGAVIRIDGKKVGLTPWDNKRVLIGEHEIQIEKRGYVALNEKIIIRENETEILDRELLRLNIVSIISKPGGAVLYIDGKEKGNTPNSIALSSGIYRLQLELDGYQEIHDEIIVGMDRTFNYTFLKQVAIRFYSMPEGADVYVDNEYIGMTPTKTEILEGDHKIVFMKDNYEDVVQYKAIKKETVLKAELKLLKFSMTDVEERNRPDSKKKKTEPKGDELHYSRKAIIVFTAIWGIVMAFLITK